MCAVAGADTLTGVCMVVGTAISTGMSMLVCTGVCISVLPGVLSSALLGMFFDACNVHAGTGACEIPGAPGAFVGTLSG